MAMNTKVSEVVAAIRKTIEAEGSYEVDDELVLKVLEDDDLALPEDDIENAVRFVKTGKDAQLRIDADEMAEFEESLEDIAEKLTE